MELIADIIVKENNMRFKYSVSIRLHVYPTVQCMNNDKGNTGHLIAGRLNV